MAKSRRNRAKSARVDPIAKPVKAPSDPELAKLREARILPVVKDLQSTDIKARTAAASAIANLAQDKKYRKLLLREQIVHHVLTQTLTDNSIDGRAAGWDILRVLAQEEEADFCVHLYRVDILTAIEYAAKTVLETITATEPPFSKLLKTQQKLLWNITGSLLTLIGLLAVARDEILEAIVANQTILRLLFRLAATNVTPQAEFEEAISCLMTLSEENLAFGQALINDQETRIYDTLIKLASGRDSKAVLACGVLHNVFSSLDWLDHSPGKDGACDAVLISALAEALKHVSVGSNATNGAGADHEATAQLALEILASIATDLQATLVKGNRSQRGGAAEAVAEDEEWNGFNDDGDAMEVDEGNGANGEDDSQDEDEEEQEKEEDDDDDDDNLSDMDRDMERVTGNDDDENIDGAFESLPTLRDFIRQAVPGLVRLATQPVDNDKALDIQAYAFAALSNLAWTLACLDFADSSNEPIAAAWRPVAKDIWRHTIAPVLASDSADLRLASQVTGLAWAVSRALAGETPSDGTQHRKFISLYRAASSMADAKEDEDAFQALGVKCIGVLGSLAQDPAPITVNREVGVFLMTLLAGDETKTPPLADVIEALNQLFDIYGDENAPCDSEVFWKNGFLGHLEAFLPKLKKMAKSIDKRAQEELRTRANEAVLNLGRFIKYKQKHAAKQAK